MRRQVPRRVAGGAQADAHEFSRAVPPRRAQVRAIDPRRAPGSRAARAQRGRRRDGHAGRGRRVGDDRAAARSAAAAGAGGAARFGVARRRRGRRPRRRRRASSWTAARAMRSAPLLCQAWRWRIKRLVRVVGVVGMRAPATAAAAASRRRSPASNARGRGGRPACAPLARFSAAAWLRIFRFPFSAVTDAWAIAATSRQAAAFSGGAAPCRRAWRRHACILAEFGENPRLRVGARFQHTTDRDGRTGSPAFLVRSEGGSPRAHE